MTYTTKKPVQTVAGTRPRHCGRSSQVTISSATIMSIGSISSSWSLDRDFMGMRTAVILKFSQGLDLPGRSNMS